MQKVRWIMPHTMFPKARLQHRKFSALTLVNPQWLGSGDILAYSGALRIAQFLSEAIPYAENEVEGPGLPEEFMPEDLKADEDPEEKKEKDTTETVIAETKAAYRVLKDLEPEKLLTVGGSEEADAASLYHMFKLYQKDIAVIWISPRSNFRKKDEEKTAPFRDRILSVLTGREREADYLPLYIPSDRIIHVGGKGFGDEEKEAFKDAGITAVSWEEDFLSVISDWLSEKKVQKIYLHLSLDALDMKAFTEGSVSLPEGITWVNFIDAVNYLNMAYDIMGIGIFDTKPESIEDERIMELIEFGVEKTGFTAE